MGKSTVLRLFFALIISAPIAHAQDLAQPRGEVTVGKMTKLPIPRFVSIKSNEANVRRGPSIRYKIDWVYRLKNMPMMVTDEFENWRRVQDMDGAGGWIHFQLLSGRRTAYFPFAESKLYVEANDLSAVSALVEEGAVMDIDRCALDWCYLKSKDGKGWAPKTTFWGSFSDEVFD